MNIIEVAYSWAKQLEQRKETKFIVVHHAAAKKCTVNDIHQWHLANGWAGIGYHFFIAKDGTVFRGRPINTIGAHVQGYNHDSVGICLEGDLNVENIATKQGDALVDLLIYLQKLYNGAKVVKHKDLYSTSCPGNNFDENLILKAMEGVKYVTLADALKILVDSQIISSPDYWLKIAPTTQYLDKLIINMANYVNNHK